MTKAILSSEMSVLTGDARRHVSEDVILHSHRRKNLRSYIGLICFATPGLPVDLYVMQKGKIFRIVLFM
jgi:hypothetical protein